MQWTKASASTLYSPFGGGSVASDEGLYEGPTKRQTRESVKGLRCGGRGCRLSRSGAVDHDGGQGDLERWTSQSLKRLR